MHKNCDPYARLGISEQLYQESRAMAEHALSNGYQVPVDVVKTIERFASLLPSRHPKETSDEPGVDLEPLIVAHQTLSSIVKPALPRTLLLLDREQDCNSRWLILGPVPIIRQMMVAALISLTAFIILSLSPDVASNAGNMLKSDGLVLLQNLLFFLAAAGLGAGFAALYKANSFIMQGTFDPSYHASYWIRFCLGLISGLVLSVMASDNVLSSAQGAATATLDAASAVATTSTMESNGFLDPAFIRPMLAMLGGFSAELLYTILNRLVETVGSLFQGSTKNLLEMKQQEAEARLAANKTQSQIELAARLVKLQQEIGNGSDPAEIQAKLDQMLKDVMPDTGKTGS
ncbi:MAG: hypothetical protein A2061_07185 [Gallionellales bacterium GWA2_59_43]|nr:MAG: hypothetical protein A2061_07185 [Gallionellales bacterium GWA2_59_43]